MAALHVIRDGPLPGPINMHRDSQLMATHTPGDDPVLRLYRWSPPAVSLGYHQDASEFDLPGIAARGYDLVRRPTGGRAILHADELTYAVVGSSPSQLFGISLHDTYQVINRALLLFLHGLGLIPEVSGGESHRAQQSLVCFHSAGQHEIRVQGRKLIGSAQRRTRGVFLQHGSILTGPGHACLANCLIDDAAGGISSQQLLAASTDLGHLLGQRIEEAAYCELIDRLVTAFARVFALPVVWGGG